MIAIFTLICLIIVFAGLIATGLYMRSTSLNYRACDAYRAGDIAKGDALTARAKRLVRYLP